MMAMNVKFEKGLDEGVQVGSEPCACGSCHPTATVYQDDPHYECHDPHLAEGPCCCGRFFVLGDTVDTARARAEHMVAQRQNHTMTPSGYHFRTQPVALPWGAQVIAVIADRRT